MPPSASARSRVVGESNRAMDGDSVEITRLRAQPAKHRAQVLEVARDQVLDAVDLLPAPAHRKQGGIERSEEHTSELQSLMRISYAVFCLKNKNTATIRKNISRVRT